MEPRVSPADRGSRAVAPQRTLAVLAGAAALAALLIGCADASGPDASAGNLAALTITETDVHRWIALLSDDSMAGRGTPSPELERAAAAVGLHFRGLGLTPLFSGSFFQRYPVPTAVTPVAAAAPADSTAPNVAGMLEGGDADRRGEYVVFVAHMDHIGTAGRPGDQCVAVLADSICNGADDNASGTAGLMELAEAFAAMTARPARSIIFLAVSGEEHGLWGSAWFLDHPPVPVAQIVAAINLDMISRNARDSVLVGGLDLSTLGAAALAAAAAHPENGMRPVVGPTGGSDQVTFWERGVPFLMFFNGLHADYHRPSDTVDRIDAEKAARIVRLAFYTGLAAADAPARPAWLAPTPVAAARP